MKSIDLDNLSVEGHSISNLTLDRDASEYKGYKYRAFNSTIIQRTAKTTPKKIGQFVTLWKRNSKEATCSLEVEDNFDFVIILCKKNKHIGKFIFSKETLLEKGIIRAKENKSKGKRGFRVYPNWDTPTSKQAIKTQNWQSLYFSSSSSLERANLKNK